MQGRKLLLVALLLTPACGSTLRTQLQQSAALGHFEEASTHYEALRSHDGEDEDLLALVAQALLHALRTEDLQPLLPLIGGGDLEKHLAPAGGVELGGDSWWRLFAGAAKGRVVAVGGGRLCEAGGGRGAAGGPR